MKTIKEPKGYTFVGNVANNLGLRPDLLEALRETHPVLYKVRTYPENERAALARHTYMFEGLRTLMHTNAYDLDGVLITPHGSYLAMHVHNADMDEYNRRYEAGMSRHEKIGKV